MVRAMSAEARDGRKPVPIRLGRMLRRVPPCLARRPRAPHDDDPGV
jgi:hypothetical protein